MKFVSILLAVVLLAVSAAARETVSGFVFEDLDRNGVRDDGEPGIASVAVSNETEVVQTDQNGFYRLPVSDQMIVHIRKPSGYDLPLNEHNLPQFYYIHNTRQNQNDFKYEGLPQSGPLPGSVNFALYKSKIKDDFRAFVVGDPQVSDSAEAAYFRDDIITGMLSHRVDFYLALGDIAYDRLEIYDMYNNVVSSLGIPVYNVIGNHDLNFRSESDRHSTETFSRYFGPVNYSFDYGKVHFVVLDVIDYFGWDNTKNKKGHYRGRISTQALTWLRNDLRFVPEDYLVVLASHIPVYTAFSTSDGVNVTNRDELFEILKQRSALLSLSGHMHFIENLELGVQAGWDHPGRFFSLNAGAGCGAWWSGPKDGRGIPEALCMDGSPNGFFIFDFDGSRHTNRFFAANRNSEFQLRVSFPESEVSPADSTYRIVVNVFNAPPGTEVFATIDDGPLLPLSRQTMADPFAQKYVRENRHLIHSWINGAVPINHIWTAALPPQLRSGMHKIKVEAVLPGGDVLSGYKIFSVSR